MNYRGNGLMWDDQCAERVIEWYKEKAVYRRFAGTGSRPVILEKSGQQFLYRKYDFQHIKGFDSRNGGKYCTA